MLNNVDLPLSIACKRCRWNANSVDPDQTAPIGAVSFGSTLFAQACLSENLGSRLLYTEQKQNLYKCHLADIHQSMKYASHIGLD